jgi:hypothetical protein
MDRYPYTLSDADISSARAVSRRTLLTALGLGAGLAAAAAAGVVPTQAQQSPVPKPKPRDPCRDADHGPPSDSDGCPKPPTS